MAAGEGSGSAIELREWRPIESAATQHSARDDHSRDLPVLKHENPGWIFTPLHRHSLNAHARLHIETKLTYIALDGGRDFGIAKGAQIDGSRELAGDKLAIVRWDRIRARPRAATYIG